MDIEDNGDDREKSEEADLLRCSKRRSNEEEVGTQKNPGNAKKFHSYKDSVIGSTRHVGGGRDEAVDVEVLPDDDASEEVMMKHGLVWGFHVKRSLKPGYRGVIVLLLNCLAVRLDIIIFGDKSKQVKNTGRAFYDRSWK